MPTQTFLDLIRRMLVGLILSLCCAASAAQRTGAYQFHEIDTHRLLAGLSPEETWEQLGLSNYVFSVRRKCYCAGPHHVRVYVVQGKIKQLQDLDSGEVIRTADIPDGFMTIAEYFAFIRQQYANYPARAVVRHHQTLGYPELIEFDSRYNIADDEFRFEISDVLEIRNP